MRTENVEKKRYSMGYRYFKVFFTNISFNVNWRQSNIRSLRTVVHPALHTYGFSSKASTWAWKVNILYFKSFYINSDIFYSCSRSFSTKVEEPSQNPVWATKHVFPNIAPEELNEVQLDVTVWNFSHSVQHECIGKKTLCQ